MNDYKFLTEKPIHGILKFFAPLVSLKVVIESEVKSASKGLSEIQNFHFFQKKKIKENKKIREKVKKK